MCALGHKLEERGFSTVALASVRVQAEKTRPPRALWTAAMLGRPVGEPGDPAFQLRVIRRRWGCWNGRMGRSSSRIFRTIRRVGWILPIWLAPANAVAGGFAAELAAMLTLWPVARTRFGRTSVGLSFQAPEAWPAFADQVLAGALPVVPELGTTALSVRFLCDDIKALYGEAAQAVGPAPSARQVDTWFWRQTAAGALLRALRLVAMGSENNALKTVGGRFSCRRRG